MDAGSVFDSVAFLESEFEWNVLFKLVVYLPYILQQQVYGATGGRQMFVGECWLTSRSIVWISFCDHCTNEIEIETSAEVSLCLQVFGFTQQTIKGYLKDMANAAGLSSVLESNPTPLSPLASNIATTSGRSRKETSKSTPTPLRQTQPASTRGSRQHSSKRKAKASPRVGLKKPVLKSPAVHEHQVPELVSLTAEKAGRIKRQKLGDLDFGSSQGKSSDQKDEIRAQGIAETEPPAKRQHTGAEYDKENATSTRQGSQQFVKAGLSPSGFGQQLRVSTGAKGGEEVQRLAKYEKVAEDQEVRRESDWASLSFYKGKGGHMVP
jgi:hypothetical protein